MFDDKELVVGVLIVVVMGALMLTGLAWLNSAKCERQWAQSGLRSDWGLFQGCIVQRKDGTWVPASAIRDLSL